MWCWDSHAVQSDDDEAFSEESEDSCEEIVGTAVPQGLFAPPEPMCRSGGTAAFFRMRYIGDPRDRRYARGEDFWIGKDLARAADELRFYEQIKTLDPEAFRLLHRWAMAYGGVCVSRCTADDAGALEPEERQLLLLENLRCGTQALRMLDIKLGEETAVAGWKGKSKQAATRNRVIDRMTNSKVQGFRLEGFDNQPATLRSQAAVPPNTCVALSKRSKRFKLQRLRAQEFLAFWLDNTELAEEACPAKGDVLLPVEYGECLLFDLVRKLTTLCVDATRMPVAQMWIGSSLAVCCEGGRLPDRQFAFQALSSPEVHRGGLTRLKVFDWGRSELNTPEADQNRKIEERQKRCHYWDIWQRGALRVLYDCARLYRNQYCADFNPTCQLWLKAWDYDTLDANDLIGVASLPLAPTRGLKTVRLRRAEKAKRKLKAEVVLEVLQLPLPAGRSRLSQAWRVIVHRVRNLPRMDVFSATDPLIIVEVNCPGCDSAPKESTPVIWNDQNAEFNAALDFATAMPETVASFYGELSRVLGQPVDASLFPLEGAPQDLYTAPVGYECSENGSHGGSDRGFEDFLRRVRCFAHLARRPSGTLEYDKGRR